MNQVPQTSRVAQVNDRFRKSFVGGTVVITTGMQALPEKHQQAILAQVQCFDAFTEDNDPYGEHDFGSFTCQGCLINWKIDYYDLNMEYLSEDPSDPSKTKRVLTIMLAEEY